MKTKMGGVEGQSEGGQEGGDVCLHVADSLHYTAETNNTVKQSYSYLKIWGGKIYVNIKFAIKKRKKIPTSQSFLEKFTSNLQTQG